MEREIVDRLLGILVGRFGLGLLADLRTEREGPRIILRPQGWTPSEGFHVDISTGWKNLRLEFLPGDMAGQLLIAMGQAQVENKAIFCAVAEEVLVERGEITMHVNGAPVDPRSYVDWPPHWRQLTFGLRSPYIPVESDLAVDEQFEGYLLRWSGVFLSMVVPLLPLERRPDTRAELSYIEGLPEGARILVATNRYERSRANREACISYHGARCQACGFDFGQTYGEVGEGYIQIHHITPVSQIGQNYLVNPVKDLVPVCANCHAIIHRQSPPFTVAEVAELLRRAK